MAKLLPYDEARHQFKALGRFFDWTKSSVVLFLAE